MSTPYLRIRNLTKRYGHFTALDDVTRVPQLIL